MLGLRSKVLSPVQIKSSQPRHTDCISTKMSLFRQHAQGAGRSRVLSRSIASGTRVCFLARSGTQKVPLMLSESTSLSLLSSVYFYGKPIHYEAR